MSTVGQMNLNVQGKREIHPYLKKKKKIWRGNFNPQ